jgi:hydroxymethylglutaryl-CoA lyase
VDELSKEGIQIFSLSDTIGVSNPTTIAYLFSHLIKAYPNLEFGAHLHTEPHNWREKIQAAYENGCQRFDAAMRGFGGCPMAKDDLTGNMATENVVHFFKEMEQSTGKSLLKLNHKAFLKSFELSKPVFQQPH